MQVIPGINAADFGAVKEKILMIKEFLPLDGWIHIDVTDGLFTLNVTWSNPSDLGRFLAEHLPLRKINFEIHLMVKNPERIIEDWLKAEASRLIVHEEAIVDPELILAKCEEYGAQVMIAIKPETPVEKLKPFFKDFEYFQILAVKAGPSDQEFNADVINKIRFLREQLPHAKIEVDGGINPEVAREVKEAGADIAVSTSYISQSSNPAFSFKELLKAAS